MDVFQVVVALAVIAAAAGIAVRAAHEPVILPEESEPEPVEAPPPGGAEIFPRTGDAAVAVEVLDVGVPVVNPDPERLIQTEIIIPVADGRGGAVVRLVLWIVVTGALIGLSLLGALRAVGALFG